MKNKQKLMDLEHESSLPALWRQAFRPFFLAGTLFSVLSLAVWVAVLSGQLTFTPYANVAFWHAHEMLFGFVGAIIVGFLLTAVQSWTGLRATHGKSLTLLFSLWLLARLLMVTGLTSYEWIVAVVDVSFFLVAAFFLARLVIKAGNYRNLVFVPVLVLLAGANLLTHLSVSLAEWGYYTWGMYAATMLASLLMVVIGGRVLPMFTANGTNTSKVAPLPWLEKTVLISTGLIALLYATNGASALPDYLLAGAFAIAAVSNACRAFRWRPWVTLSTPLVWSLHLAYWFIPLGFSLFALHYAGFAISSSNALHSLTAGAMGSLILAMIARVSLGHSGRPLAIHQSMKYAFVFILLAGLTRLTAGLYPALPTVAGYVLSAVFWIVAYGIYVINFARILTTPRLDGKPG